MIIDTKRILIFACLIGAAVSCREQQPVEPVVLDQEFSTTYLTFYAISE